MLLIWVMFVLICAITFVETVFFLQEHRCAVSCCQTELVRHQWQIEKYQGVKNFTLVTRMQNSSSILRPTDDESSMFYRCALPAMTKTPQNISERSNSLLSPTY